MALGLLSVALGLLSVALGHPGADGYGPGLVAVVGDGGGVVSWMAKMSEAEHCSSQRKPPQMGFTSWIDQQVADAERRGVFDDLPGAGKPLNLRPGAPDGDYGQAWLRDYARREGVAAEEMLPTPLRLRREIERLAETAGEFRSEQEVREAAADLNRRIVEWRRIPVGPPVHVRLVNADDLVARWRGARSERLAREAGRRTANERPPADPSSAGAAPPALACLACMAAGAPGR